MQAYSKWGLTNASYALYACVFIASEAILKFLFNRSPFQAFHELS